MKNLCIIGLMLPCLFAGLSTNAQQPARRIPDIAKQALFTPLPKRFECNTPALKKLTNSRVAEIISLQLDAVKFDGEVVEKIQRSPGVTSMNIRLSNYPGSLFTISVITEADNSQKLVGRIVNPNSDEILVLTEENNRYFFVKEPRRFLMTE